MCSTKQIRGGTKRGRRYKRRIKRGSRYSRNRVATHYPCESRQKCGNGDAYKPSFTGTKSKSSEEEHRHAEIKRQPPQGFSPQPLRHQVKTEGSQENPSQFIGPRSKMAHELNRLVKQFPAKPNPRRFRPRFQLPIVRLYSCQLLPFPPAGTDMFELSRCCEADAAYTSTVPYDNCRLFLRHLVHWTLIPSTARDESDEVSGVGLVDRFRTHWRKGKMNYNAISGIGRCRNMQDPQPEQAAS